VPPNNSQVNKTSDKCHEENAVNSLDLFSNLMVVNILDQLSEINTNPSSSSTKDSGVNTSTKYVLIAFPNTFISLYFINAICRDSYNISLADETKLFKLCALQTNALKSLEVIMTSSMCVDILVNPISSKSKQSTDANKNAICDNKKKCDNIKENDAMNNILMFLFRLIVNTIL